MKTDTPNPWEKMKNSSDANGEYILDIDRAHIDKLRNKLNLELFPEPFIGNPEAQVYLLNLNPGFNEADKEDMEDLKNYIFKNYRHKCPFYYLNDNLKETNGGKWWRQRLKELIEECGIKKVANNVFCVEYFPYHSNKWTSGKVCIPSQEYNQALIEKAITERKLFIVMRKQLFSQIEELKTYKNILFLNNWRNVSISKKNIENCLDNPKNGWKKIIEKISSS
ncbi:MAG: hypothetical protein LBC75_09350 [Fibromonadaceae bacterium]|jgi:hypothetical protein|nr:hypothetical protein [Fibromonadaceae bacterium]